MGEDGRGFVKLLKRNFEMILGIEISQKKAMELFKAAIVTAVEFLMGKVDREKMEDVKLAIRGIGVWEIRFRRPRVIAGRPSKLVGKTEWVPGLWFRPSTRFKRIMVREFCGFELPIPVSKRNRKDTE